MVAPIRNAWKNVEFENLIPGKSCFWKENFAILRKIHHLDGYFCLFLTKISEKLYKIQIVDGNYDHIPGNFCIFFLPALVIYLHCYLYGNWREWWKVKWTEWSTGRRRWLKTERLPTWSSHMPVLPCSTNTLDGCRYTLLWRLYELEGKKEEKKWNFN